MDDGLIEMVVESVRVHMLSSRHVVILKETGRERYLPIWIGPWEASSIAMRLQGLTPERPLTHDLFASTLEALDATVARVVISDMVDETYHARLFVERPSQKAIVIGTKGARLKDVGTRARKQIEALLGTPVYLDLHIKIAKDWQRDPKQLRRLGF